MILAVDTASPQLRLALMSDAGDVLLAQVFAAQRRQTELLSPAIDSALADTGTTPGEISAVGVATGPGSFSGLRTALAWAKGFALATGVPLVGVPTLDILAHAQPPARHPEEGLWCVMQSGRGRIAAARYAWAGDSGWLPDGWGQITTWDALADLVNVPATICGELDDAGRALLASRNDDIALAPPHRNVRRPVALAELTRAALLRGATSDPATLTPDYWHQPHVTPPGTSA